LLSPIVKALGLVRQFNPLATAEGALSKADDCVISRENIIEDRRGYKRDSAFTDNIKQTLSFEGEVLVHHGDNISYYDGANYQTFAGNYEEIPGERIKGVEVNSNLMMTTSNGVVVAENLDTSNELRLAGAPRSLDPKYILSSGDDGFLQADSQVAYRVVIKRTDSNDNVFFGYPSQRLLVTNDTTGAENVHINIFMPEGVMLGDIFQVYRTEQIAGVDGDNSGDDMKLVYEREVVDDDFNLNLIVIKDVVVDELRGAALYTNATQEGLGQANGRPPVCRSMAVHKTNYTFYANTETRHRLQFTLVGTDDLVPFVMFIDGVEYTFASSENANIGQVQVFNTPSVAVNIDLTARSLVNVINRYSANTSVYAYYLSEDGDLPGKILLEERSLSGSAFTVQAGNSLVAEMLFPIAPVSPSTSDKMTASNDRRKNAVYYSKFQQHEHVPELNYLLVGPANREILGIVALNDSTIVISEDGVYRITGDDPSSFIVTRINVTAICRAKESIAVLSNQVFMLSTQGVVRISETDVEVISREIELLINPLLQNSNLSSLTNAVAYESDRQYYLSTASDSGATESNVIFVYNIFTRSWVRWTFGFQSAVVELNSDRLYFSKPDDDTLYVERKSLTDADFADLDYEIDITSINGAVIEFTMSGVAPTKGWTVEQGTTSIPIVSIEPITGGYRATMERSAAPFSEGLATIYQPVGMSLEWNTWTAGNPVAMKQVRNSALLGDDTLNRNTVTSMDFNFRSNFDGTPETVSLLRPKRGWGSAWGGSPWGGQSDSLGYVTYVPMNKQYCTRFYFGVDHTVALERLSISGVSHEFEMVSEEQGL